MNVIIYCFCYKYLFNSNQTQCINYPRLVLNASDAIVMLKQHKNVNSQSQFVVFKCLFLQPVKKLGTIPLKPVLKKRGNRGCRQVYVLLLRYFCHRGNWVVTWTNANLCAFKHSSILICFWHDNTLNTPRVVDMHISCIISTLF